MSYATPRDMQARFPAVRLAEITDPAGLAVDEAALQRALDAATQEMDAYLGQRYELPLVTPSAVPTWVCCDIAVYRLMTLLPKEVLSDARHRYKDAVDWLKDIADGVLSLAPGAALPVGGGNTFGLDSTREVFTQARLHHFRDGFGGVR
jgi:phage gp36-like protein